MASQIHERGPQFSSPESMQALCEFYGARREAMHMMQKNHLPEAFGLMDLTDPSQAHQEEELRGFIAKRLLLDKLRDGENKQLRAAVEIAEAQNVAHLDQEDPLCRNAFAIFMSVDFLFDTVFNKTGKPVNPGVSINKKILDEWKGWERSFVLN